MKLGKIYEFAIKEGINSDPRGKKEINKQLKRIKTNYKRLSVTEKNEFDQDSLFNPYADTRILYGDKNKQIRRILVGIDMGVGEILLADRLSKEKKVDLLLSHHPQGMAFAGFYEVMQMQVDMLSTAGIATVVAEDLMRERIKEVERKVLPANHNRAVDVAKLLNMAFLCIHTPSDNLVAKFLEKKIEKLQSKTLSDILKALKQIPEYKQATLSKAGPKIILGQPDAKAGKILLEMTGGSEGPKEVFDRLSQAGWGTLICMHLSEEHFKKVKDARLNVIVAGHIASDNLGLNLFLDKLERQEKLEFIPCSGFRRIRRQ